MCLVFFYFKYFFSNQVTHQASYRNSRSTLRTWQASEIEFHDSFKEYEPKQWIFLTNDPSSPLNKQRFYEFIPNLIEYNPDFVYLKRTGFKENSYIVLTADSYYTVDNFESDGSTANFKFSGSFV